MYMNTTGCPLILTNFVAIFNKLIDLLKVHLGDSKDDPKHKQSKLTLKQKLYQVEKIRNSSYY